MNKIKALINKEWSEIFKNKMVLSVVILLPLLFAAMPILTLVGIDSLEATEEIATELETSMEYYDLPEYFIEQCDGMNGQECMQYFMITQFLVLFMMIPVIIPSTIAAYSIVGEKTARTLEPLLATPIKTIELLLGKVLAAFLPALAATFLSFSLFVISLFFVTEGDVIIRQVVSPLWLGAIFGVGTLLSIAGVCFSVMISSRVNDPRVAEQLSGLLVLPFVGLMLAQSFGAIIINQQLIYWIMLITFLIDLVLLYFAIQLFDRETILTRWK